MTGLNGKKLRGSEAEPANHSAMTPVTGLTKSTEFQIHIDVTFVSY